MAIERTLSILKPDALEHGVIGKVVACFEAAGLKPVAMKMKQLTRAEAEGFYAVHAARPFSPSSTCTMTGPWVMKATRSLKNGRAEWTA